MTERWEVISTGRITRAPESPRRQDGSRPNVLGSEGKDSVIIVSNPASMCRWAQFS